MRISIEPITTRIRDSLKDLLATFGLPPHIVEWKYFGRPVGLGEDRGWAWVRHGRVQGVIGVIPFDCATPTGRTRGAWTCDWFVHASSDNPGIGVVLIRHAALAMGRLFSLGGNEVNHRVMMRLAAQTTEDAGLEFYLPLRLGGSRWFRGVSRRLADGLGFLEGIPVSRRNVQTAGVAVVPGVAAALAPMLEWGTCRAPFPVYELDYLKWQLEHCPGLVATSFYVPSTEATAGAVGWRPAQAGSDWRVALWSRNDEDEQTALVLQAAVDRARQQGAQRVALLAARCDRRRIQLLRRLGFVTCPETRPLYVTVSPAEPPLELASLSFVDSDLAYRF